MHSLLKRQLKRCLGDSPTIPEPWQRFIDTVNEAYQESDAHLRMLERSLDLSSQELLQANSELRAIFQAIPDLLIRLDRGGAILECSSSGAADFFLHPSQFIGKRIQDIPLKRIADVFNEAIQRVQETNSMVSFEYDLTMQARQHFYEARFIPVPEHQMIAIIRNVTEWRRAEQALQEAYDHMERLVEDRTAELSTKNRQLMEEIEERRAIEETSKVSEKRFRKLIENIPLGIALIRKDRTFEYFNPMFLQLFGYSLGDLRHLQDWLQKLGLEPHVVERIASFQQGDAANQPPAGEMYTGVRACCKDGREKIVNIRTVAMDDGSLILTHSDKTEHYRLENRLRQADKIEAIGTLAGGIAHDFNNILGIIMGYSELAKLDLTANPTARESIELALEACQRGRNLVRQILSFSHVDEEQHRQPVDICRIVKETLRFLRATIPTTIEILQDIPSRGIMVFADATQIHQVLTNLGANAAQAMEETGGVMEISLVEADFDPDTAPSCSGIKPGPYVRLTVRDTGHGMDARTIERIFDPYFTTKQISKGSGLGLAVVHGIVKGHEGAIRVSSEIGKGSVFQVFLPRIECKKEEEEKAQEELLKGTERVLFVDDEAALVHIAQRALRLLGYEILVKTSSLEALELFRAHPHDFDLVITDYTMPHMTGEELAREIMRIRSDIPVILCTGFNERISEARARDLGISAFAMKPFALHDIAATIRKVLDG